MIAPRTRLLLVAAVLLLPLAGWVAVAPPQWPLALAVCGVAVLLAAIDAVRAPLKLASVRVDAPELVRLTKDVPGAIDLVVHHDLPLPLLRLAFALPPGLEQAQEETAVALPSPEVPSRIPISLTPRVRGQFTLTEVFVESASSWGLWVTRQAKPLAIELRVYPNLMSERKKLAALFLNRGLLGVHAQRRVGRGRDFAKLREYVPGDSYEDIHWKATARRGHPVTKLYQVERTQEVYVVLDGSRLSARASTDAEGVMTTELERFIAASLTLGLVAERQGDLFGLVQFSDRVRSFVPARTGKQHFNTCREALYMMQPRQVNPDFEDLFTFLRLRLRKRALILILTNLDDPVLAESFARNLRLIQRHHLVLVSMITPPGVAQVFSGGLLENIEDLYAKLSGHMQWQDLREWQRRLKLAGVTFSLVESAALAPELVSQYVQVKQRQAL